MHHPRAFRRSFRRRRARRDGRRARSRYGKQIGGYYLKWPTIALLTVHGAGHMVPTTTPEKAFEVWSSYLNGKVPVVTNDSH